MDRVEHVKIIVGRLWWIMPVDSFLACGFIIACDNYMASLDGVDGADHLSQ